MSHLRARRLRLIVAAVAGLLAFCLFTRFARAAPRLLQPDDEAFADGDRDASDLVGRATVGRAVMRSPPGGETWLSLAGFTRSSLAGEREVGAFVVVGLPLDRLARIGTHASMSGSGAIAPLVNVANSAEGEVVGISPRAARATVEVAWRAAGLAVDDARLDAIMSRARWSAALPETRLRAMRFDDARLYGDPTTDPARSRDSTGARVGLEARLTWRFDHLLYADDEPSFERMRMERHDARARIAARVLEALFHWHRAWLELRFAQAASREAREPPSRPSRDELEAALRVAEAEATLDVLTAGWFTSSRSRAVIGRPAVTSPPPASVPQAL